MSSRTLFGFWHGLGDNIMAIPALRQYRKSNPDTYIGWAVRRDIDASSLMELCPYIDEVVPFFDDPWILPTNNRYVQGMTFRFRQFLVRKMFMAFARKKGYDGALFITTKARESKRRLYGSYRYHKIFRIADEMGVEPEGLHTEVFIDKEDRKKAKRWLRNVARPRVFVHREASIRRKEADDSLLQELLGDYKDHTVVEVGSKGTVPGAHLLDLDDIRRNIAVLERCDAAICIDSANMHFAGALNIPLTAIFLTTPIHQAIPLHYETRVICHNDEYNRLWSKSKMELGRRYPNDVPETWTD